MFRRDRTSEIKLKYNKLKVKVGEFMCYTLLSTLQNTPNETNPSYPPWADRGVQALCTVWGKPKLQADVPTAWEQISRCVYVPALLQPMRVCTVWRSLHVTAVSLASGL